MKRLVLFALLAVVLVSVAACAAPASDALTGDDLERWRASGPRSYPADIAARIVDQAVLESKRQEEVIELLGQSPVAAGYVDINDPGAGEIVYPLDNGGALSVTFAKYRVERAEIAGPGAAD